jgi:hypothetical protein
MASFNSEDGRASVSRSESDGESLILRLSAVLHRRSRPAVIVYALASIVGVGAVLGGYLALRPEEKPPVKLKAVPAASPWKAISERMIQAEQGQFPINEGILTFSTGPAASDAEIRSVVGTFELPRYGAAQIESGESWGITAANRDEFVMYVHNFLNAPITAMVLRISEGTCDSFGPQSKTTWASAYWADALGGGKEAIFQATLPVSYNLPSYCAVIYRVYSSRTL